MTSYTELWREVEARLLAASALMRADAPALFEHLAPQFSDWLAHNELELALDELLDGAEDENASLRRRFWEELATAAMRMTLERQFLRIADRIQELEPHIFGASLTPPRVYCDFNGFIETDVYSLNGVGTALDFARLRLVPFASLNLVLYEHDSEDDGSLTWLLVDAVLVEHRAWGLVAKVKAESRRWESRS